MLAVIGLGYVGITSLLCFRELGAEVIGLDSDPNVLTSLRSGKINVADEKLGLALNKNIEKLRLTSSYKDLEDAKEALICVPTEGDHGRLDLGIVNEVLKNLENTKIEHVWIRSTIDDPSIFDRLTNEAFSIGSYPEFLREGKCWTDFFEPPLVVLGQTISKESIVSNLLTNNFPSINFCTPKEAITVKLFCNAFHALKVAFANEASAVRWKDQINIQRVMEIFTQDHKLNLSPYYLKPGLPFGGPCLPKDTAALASAVSSNPSDTLLGAVKEQNERQKRLYVERIRSLGVKHVGFYGYEFKQGTGDTRNSPLLEIALLVSEFCKVSICHEPHPKTRYSRFVIHDKCGEVTEVGTLLELHEKCDLIISDYSTGKVPSLSWQRL